MNNDAITTEAHESPHGGPVVNMTTAQYNALLARSPNATVADARPSKRWHLTGYRNQWEAAYAAHLENRRSAGEISRWWYEPFSFTVVASTRGTRGVKYLADFMVLLPTGRIEVHEVKGRERRDDPIRFKACAERFSMWRWVMVRKDRDGWEIVRDIDRTAGL